VGITFALSSFKFIDNYVRMGEFLPNNNDPKFNYHFVKEHSATYRGLASYLDFNVFKLIPEPVLAASTSGSYPVIFYATFWYQYVPESSFVGNRRRPSMYLGSAMYILGLLPSVLFLIGWISNLRPPRPKAEALLRFAGAVLILLICLIFLAAAARYHVWSAIQARYIFPAMFAGVLAFAEGMRIVDRWPAVRRVLAINIWALTIVFLVYYVTECWHWV
jgi:hypothetical protein